MLATSREWLAAGLDRIEYNALETSLKKIHLNSHLNYAYVLVYFVYVCSNLKCLVGVTIDIQCDLSLTADVCSVCTSTES